MPLVGEMGPVAPLSTLGSPDDACGYPDTYPTLRHALSEPTQSLHFYLPLQCHVFYHPDLTSYLQFCELQGPIANMASEHETMDMERFQRLSDTYQPDVQVRCLR